MQVLAIGVHEIWKAAQTGYANYTTQLEVIRRNRAAERHGICEELCRKKSVRQCVKWCSEIISVKKAADCFCLNRAWSIRCCRSYVTMRRRGIVHLRGRLCSVSAYKRRCMSR